MKYYVIKIIQFALKLFFVFSIRKNRIVFSAYSGKSYSCNPKYLSEWLQKNDANAEIIWAFLEPEKFGNQGFKTVKFKSLKYLYYILTAAVVVDNVESWSILPKRKGQLVINTWHGGGAYKGVGLMRRDTDGMQDKNMLNKHGRIDTYLSSSEAFTEMTLRKSFGFRGTVLSCGMPRNDILINCAADTELKKEILEKLGIEAGKKLAIFAPTFRHDAGYSFDFDYESILSALTARFGGEWVFLFRTHYYVQGVTAGGPAVNVADYPDMQELLLVSDVLFTDYSSSIWDFSLMEKPAFLYTPDIRDYADERAFYTPIAEWPYPYADNVPDLCSLIVAYDEISAKEKIRAHHQSLNSFENGSAAETAGKYISEQLY